MSWVNMTVFITHCWKSVQSKLNGVGRTGFCLRALLLCSWLLGAAVLPAAAQTSANTAVEVTELRLERTDGALLLQSSLRLDLSSTVEDALQKRLGGTGLATWTTPKGGYFVSLDVLDGCEGWKIAQDMDNGNGLYAVLNKGVSGLRLGSLADSERQQCSEDMLASYDVALDRLRAMGAEITPFENPVSYGDMADDNGMITAVEAFHNHGRFYKNPDLPMDEDVRIRMLSGEHYHAHDYFRVLQQRKETMAAFGDAMRGFDALVMPSSTSTAPALTNVDQAVSPGYFTRPFNFLEMCGLSLPINLASDGMPTSLQIVGKAHDEAMCLRIGAALEQDLPPIGRPDLS